MAFAELNEFKYASDKKQIRTLYLWSLVRRAYGPGNFLKKLKKRDNDSDEYNPIDKSHSNN